MNKLIICGFSLLSGLVLADPTMPEAQLTVVATTVAEAPLPVLTLIRHQSRQYIAVLDGQLVKLGQQHQGYNVVKISANQVVISREQRQWTLQLFPTMTK